MNLLEKKMIDILKDLKENHHVVSIKAEFEAEGTRFEEALRLKEIVTKAGLELTIKIGGCEAIKDMYDARTIGVDSIVAPMIESSYAMSKYVNATKLVFSEYERKDIKFLINCETLTGYNNLNDIITSQHFADIAGIVLGRVDMAGSMGLTRDDINSNQILDIAKDLSDKMMKSNKLMIVGGGVSTESLPFFKSLAYLSNFETRKVIFDSKLVLADSNSDKGILKAIGFELMWLKNRREFYEIILNKDDARLEMFETKYKDLIKEAGVIYV